MIEKRVYTGGSLSPEALADHLVGYFDPPRDVQAQKFGKENSWVVQIGRGDEPEDIRQAVSIAICLSDGDPPELQVTIGQQQWIHPRQTAFLGLMGLIALLATPWVLFAIIWPVSQILAATGIPDDVRTQIDTWVAAHGGAFSHSVEMQHPHKA